MNLNFKNRWRVFALALIPLLAGLALCGFFFIKFFHSFVAMDKAMVRVLMPGESTVTLLKSGDYTVFHEYKSIIDDVVYFSANDAVSGLSCSLKEDSTGDNVPLRPSQVNSTYSVGSKAGYSLYDFSVKSAGNFHLSCFFSGGDRKGTKIVFAIAQGFGAGIFSMIVLVFAGVLSLLAGIGLPAGWIIHLATKKPKEIL